MSFRIFTMKKDMELKEHNPIISVLILLGTLLICGALKMSVPAEEVKEVEVKQEEVLIEKYDNITNSMLYDKIKVDNKEAFIYEVKAMGARLDIPYEDLMGVMYFESRLNPKASNNGTALGLFQLTSIAMRQLGITKEKVLKSDYRQQLVWFEMYLEPYRHKIHNFGDVYLAVYLPGYLGKNDKKISQRFLNSNPPYRHCKTPGQFKTYITKQYNKLK
jgi:hypothetical protein